jgi:hypothetical protein
MLMDKSISDGLKDRLVPSWIELKAELIEIMLNQIRAGIKAGIMAENCRDLATCSKELRALIGDDIQKLDVKADLGEPQKIEFVFYDPDVVRRDRDTGEPTEEQPDDDKTVISLPDNRVSPRFLRHTR